MVEYSERLIWAIEKAGMDVRQLSDALDTSYQAVKKVVDGKSLAFNATNNAKAAKLLGVSGDWLAIGTGSPERGSGDIVHDRSLDPEAVDVFVPLITYEQAGQLLDGVEVRDIKSTEHLAVDWGSAKSCFALEIEGDAMTPELSKGDRVIVDASLSPEPGDYVVAKVFNETPIFRRYGLIGQADSGGDLFELVPLNQFYPTIKSDQAAVKIIGVMVEHRRYYQRGAFISESAAQTTFQLK